MADKSFGVKELNLLNASGTPTVTSPNNLNLNANTVAISTSCTIGNNLTVTSTTNSANLNVTGIGTLTRGFATDLSVSGISTISQPSNANPHSLWDVVNNGSSAYRFTGPGQSGDENNPNIYLVRGQRYIFKVNASGHPFQLRVANGGAAYSDGVTNNGAQSGNVVINVQHDAPAQLYYQCTSHGGMVGNIYIVGGPQVISGVVTATTFSGSGASLTNLPAANLTGTLPAISGANLTSLPSQATIANNADNRVITGGSGVNLNGEANLTFDGSTLAVTGQITATDFKAPDGNTNGLYAGNSDDLHLFHNGADSYIENDTGNLNFTNKNNNSIIFKTTSSETERLRIDSDGRLLIGATSSSSNAKLAVNGGMNSNNEAFFELNRLNDPANGQNIGIIEFCQGNAASRLAARIITRRDGGVWGAASLPTRFEFHTCSSGTNSAAERLRINSAGNVQLNNYSGNAGQGRLSFGDSGPAFIEGYDSGNAGSGAYLRMSINNTEKVRIPRDTWGLLVTNQASTGNTGGYQTEGVSLRTGGDSTFVRTAQAAITMTRKSDAGKILDFYNGTTYAGGIYVNGSNNTALQQGSDYRLKTDITSMTDGINKVKQLNPIYYKANSGFDTTTVQNGFLAHEVQSILPTLVDGEKDAPIDEKGKGYQTLNYAGFTPTAIAAIKELIAKVETLEAEVAALKGS